MRALFSWAEEGGLSANTQYDSKLKHKNESSVSHQPKKEKQDFFTKTTEKRITIAQGRRRQPVYIARKKHDYIGCLLSYLE